MTPTTGIPASLSDEVVFPDWLVIGFTGHRHLTDIAAAAQGIGRAVDDLSRQNPRMLGVSSAALGGDTLFGEEMLRRGCPIQIILPFSQSRFEEDFSCDRQAWRRSLALIESAIAVETVSTPDPEPRGPESAYLEAGVRTVDRSDVMIALWNGERAKGPGGTGDLVAYVEAIGRPLIVVDPVTGEISGRRLERIPHNADLTTQREASEQPKALVERYFETADHRAKRSAPLVRELIRWCVWLHLAASSVAAAAVVFGAEGRLALGVSAIDVGVLAVALTMLWFHGRHHRTWRHRRAEAEVCRSFLASWDIRRNQEPGARASVPMPGLSRFVSSLEILRQLDRSRPRPFEESRSAYKKNRVDGQIRYFTTKRAEAHRQLTRRKTLMAAFSGVGIASVIALAAVLVTGADRHNVVRYLEFLGIVSPLGASAMGILLVTDESARRNERYAEMIEALTELRPRIEAARSWDSLNRAVSLVEETLLAEVLEWQSFVRHTEHLH